MHICWVTHPMTWPFLRYHKNHVPEITCLLHVTRRGNGCNKVGVYFHVSALCSPSPPFPVPNKPSRFYGRKALGFTNTCLQSLRGWYKHLSCDQSQTVNSRSQLLTLGLHLREISRGEGRSHTPSIAFRHLTPNSAKFRYTSK